MGRGAFVVRVAVLLGVLASGWVSIGRPGIINAQAAIVFNTEFEFVRQGRAGIVTLTGPDLSGGVVTTLDRQYPFFPVTNGFAALIAVPITQKIQDYPMTVTVYGADGASGDLETTLKVASGEFIAEPAFALPSDRLYLLASAIQENEDLRLLTVYSNVTPERMWEGKFTRPVNGALGSPFGSFRTFNDQSQRRHTGYDFAATTGTPIMASASGRVVFARQMDIHGNIVIIDHGWGVFSSYSHFQDLYVVPGQYVLQGEILGLSGNTGRSTGPHLHWEIAVNGVWVDPVEFLDLKLPS